MELDAGRAARLPRRDPGDPRRRLDRGPGAGRPRRPAGRDHRSGRAQDDDQRPQLGRPGLHGRPRGRPVADVGQRRRRPGGARRRGPPHADVRLARGQGLPAQRARSRRSSSGRAAGTSSSRGCWSTACRSRPACSTSGCSCSTTAPRRLRRGSGPYLYLAKLESHHEARLWNEVFIHGQVALGIPRGSIRATVLIETILAAFEMDEILYELREHAAGLNAGRWDYLFSGIKKFRTWPDAGRPRPRAADDDRPVHARLHGAARADLPPARCARDRRHGGVHPEPARPGGHRGSRWPRSATTRSARSGDGFDGTWVAHPDLVPVAMEVFDRVLGDRPNQKDRLREDVAVSAAELLDLRVPGGAVTEAGIRANIRVALAYLDAWLRGIGAAAIDNLMEDAATAEISPLAALAVADARRRPGRRRGSSTRLAIRRSATRNWPDLEARGKGAWPRRPTCSIDSSSTTISRSS